MEAEAKVTSCPGDVSRRVLRRRTGDAGASAVEYALLVVGIAAVIVAIVFAVGRVTQANYSSVCGNWASAAGDASC